jgi:hypothetical protein
MMLLLSLSLSLSFYLGNLDEVDQNNDIELNTLFVVVLTITSKHRVQSRSGVNRFMT